MLLADERRADAAPVAVRLPLMDGGGLRRGIDLDDTSALWDR
jgi:hypothetical protein